jgi:O-antigen/teichoic acid export membrane protein
MADQGAMRMALTSYVFVGLSFPLAYLLRLFYSQTLSVEEFGAFFALVSFVLIIATFNDFGLSEALAYFIPRLKRKEQNAYFTAAISVQTTTSVLIGALLFLFATPLAILITGSAESAPILSVLILYFFGMNLSATISSYLRGRQDTGGYTSVESVRLVSILIASFIAGLVSDTLFAYALAWVVGIFFMNALYTFYTLRKYELRPARFDIPVLRTMFVYALPLIIATSSSIVMSYLDTVMVSSIAGTLEAGYYAAALPTAKLLFIITMPLALITFPLTSRKHHEKDFAYLRTFFRYVHEWIVLLILPAAGVLLAFSTEILRIIFGEAYVPASNTLSVLAVSFVLGGIASVQTNILAGLGKPKSRAKVVILAGIVNIILNLILIPVYGGVGAAIGLLIANIIIVTGFSSAIQREVGFRIRARVVFIAVSATLLATITAIALKEILQLNVYLEAGIILTIMAAIYATIVLVSRIIDWAEVISMVRTNVPVTERVIRYFE